VLFSHCIREEEVAVLVEHVRHPLPWPLGARSTLKKMGKRDN
jgi:hypothetical protein